MRKHGRFARWGYGVVVALAVLTLYVEIRQGKWMEAVLAVLLIGFYSSQLREATRER